MELNGVERLPYRIPPVSDVKLYSQMVEDAMDWAHAYGLVMRTSQNPDCSDTCQSAPFTLFPSPFPKALFNEACELQNAMNLLYFRISWDYEFLMRAHREVVLTDKFTKNMADMLTIIWKEGIRQKRTLLIQRADYMCHNQGNRNPPMLRQVEVNNIAASMGALGERATILHRRILQDIGLSSEAIKNGIPKNGAVDCISSGIFQGWEQYGVPSAVVLFVVEATNQNQIDQRFIEYGFDLLSDRKVKCVRMTLTQCVEKLSLGGVGGDRLMIGGTAEVAVVYFRAGYVPDHYGDKEWRIRLLMERSMAIKSPWIGLQLANTKKVQQMLTQPGLVEYFLPESPELCVKIRSVFAGMWALEDRDPQSILAIERAISGLSDYVLKPQLEGGAGNYYGSEVGERLVVMSRDERAAHILMERIKPLSFKNYHLRPYQASMMKETVSELGIFGYLIGDGSSAASERKVLYNHVQGHVLRSKAEGVDKGGVAIGAALIDSPFLY